MGFFNQLIKPTFKEDDKGNIIYYPSFHEAFIIDSKSKKNEIIQFYKKASVLLPFFILSLLLGSFAFLFILGISPIFIIFFASFAPYLYEKKIKKMTKDLPKVDKLKIKGLSNIIAQSISLFTLIFVELVFTFLIAMIISFIFNSKQKPIEFVSSVIIIIICFSICFITGKAIIMRLKSNYTD
ncbi:MAG: hypothetical protein OXN83_00195 [Oligoflexia bacterium]|nr:hypothetical protein [Oligoflexia bacterium]